MSGDASSAAARSNAGAGAPRETERAPRGSNGWVFTLARLAFVRSLPWKTLALVALVLALVRWTQATSEPDVDAWLGAGALAGDAARHATWSLGALLVLPLLVARASIPFRRWRAGELDFLAPRATPRAGIVFATWLGQLAALAVALALVALAAELGTGDAPTWVDRGRLRAESLREGGGVWVRADAPWSVRVDLPIGSDVRRVSFPFALGAGGGPATEVELRARRIAPSATPAEDVIVARARAGTQGELELELPPGGGALRLDVALVDPNARLCLLDEGARAWAESDSRRFASLGLFVRLWVLGALLCAFTFAASAFVAPAIAVWGALALALAPGIAADPALAWPGVDLELVLETLARGRVPAAPSAWGALAALAVALLLLGLAGFARAPWRRSR